MIYVIGPFGKSGAANPKTGQRTKRARKIRAENLFIPTSLNAQAPFDFFLKIKEEGCFYIITKNEVALPGNRPPLPGGIREGVQNTNPFSSGFYRTDFG
jgi:hypothetical protein